VGTFRFGQPGSLVSISLRQIGGSLVGTGLLLGTGVPVSGSYDAPDVHLLLVYGAQNGAVPIPVRFEGHVDEAGMIGAMRFGDEAPFPFEFTRVDTVASGEATLILTGAITRTESSAARFFYLASLRSVVLGLESAGTGPRTTVGLEWDGLDYPREGSYTLRTDGSRPSAGVTEFGGPSGQRELLVLGGEVVIEVARRHALIGSFSITAAVPGSSATVSIEGTFSAGCTGMLC
jgi:hypothetical protein